jgi:hypothetical protein
LNTISMGQTHTKNKLGPVQAGLPTLGVEGDLRSEVVVVGAVKSIISLKVCLVFPEGVQILVFEG